MWFILKIYYSTYGTISLGEELSELFLISVGVKQGGMISPSLFHKFIDKLIFDCTNLKIGAR